MSPLAVAGIRLKRALSLHYGSETTLAFDVRTWSDLLQRGRAITKRTDNVSERVQRVSTRRRLC